MTTELVDGWSAELAPSWRAQCGTAGCGRWVNNPQPLCRAFSTTNAVEAVNGQLERLRLDNGGYFHSEPDLQLELGAATRFLDRRTRYQPCCRAALPHLFLLLTTPQTP